ncbi:trypsin-like peptidase domain-containing protein [Streptomyces sp. B93]|uniref:VMAP-C domain-containing protein n=1 Tax=Streptomyces sp. B93 TaxID=2824875 RepID=UPI001B3815BF|nr:trypsin-like peptidase domain-containing protein [Streptomyces sp. B93]MBQ1088067.1 trypsin-like peptidase domain-containing protein [Streptomyces sp. B93]
MSSASWHARISCGREVGAGFLISPRQVLTCAHVVRDRHTAAVTVAFPGAHGLGELTADVIADGGWGGGDTDPGDLAVLELERAVTLAPAEFAAPGDAFGEPPRRLLVYGFPVHYDEGTFAEYRATAEQRIAGEWVQLEAWSGHGQPLAPGFSGAAVVLADSGRVVGMVSAAAGNPGVRNGRMLPAPVMARYWAGLGELVPTGGLGRAEKRELRRLVEAAERSGVACGPDQLFRDSVDPVTGPPVPPGGFPSLWAAVWYLCWEVGDPRCVARFAGRLAGFLDDPETRHALRRWSRRYTGTEEPATAAAPDSAAWSPIVVDIERSGAGRHQVLVEVSAYRDGRRWVVGSRGLPRGKVRPYVLERVDEAFHELRPGAKVLIVFMLPREWLNEPVAHWQRGKDDPSPLGCLYPVVVVDRERRRSGSQRHGLMGKWVRLDGRDRAELYRVECGSSEDQGKLTVRLSGNGDMVGLTAPPRTARMKRTFSAVLNGSVPVVLWPRTGCDAGHDDDETCSGTEFLDALAEYVSDLPPSELPSHIRTLRETVYLSPDPDQHWAKDVTLLWEDPRCFPEIPGHARSPVG